MSNLGGKYVFAKEMPVQKELLIMTINVGKDKPVILRVKENDNPSELAE